MEQYLSRGPLGTAASSTCKQEIQGGEWCNVNKDNCEIGCSGKWCTNLMPLTYKPTTTKPTTRKPSNRMPTSKPQASSTLRPTTSKPTAQPTSFPTIKEPSTPPSQTTCNDSGDYCTNIYCCKWTKNANGESCAYTEPSTGERGINNNCCPCLPTPIPLGYCNW